MACFYAALRMDEHIVTALSDFRSFVRYTSLEHISKRITHSGLYETLHIDRGQGEEVQSTNPVTSNYEVILIFSFYSTFLVKSISL